MQANRRRGAGVGVGGSDVRRRGTAAEGQERELGAEREATGRKERKGNESWAPNYQRLLRASNPVNAAAKNAQ